jgi:hypothetical protein
LLFSHILLTEVFAGRVSEDNDKDNDNNKDEEENNDEDTNLEVEDGSNESNKYDKNRSINNDDKDNIMPPKLKQASMSPTKATKKNPEWRNSQGPLPRRSKSPHRLSSPTL